MAVVQARIKSCLLGFPFRLLDRQRWRRCFSIEQHIPSTLPIAIMFSVCVCVCGVFVYVVCLCVCVCVCVRALVCGTAPRWCTLYIVNFLLPDFTTKTWFSYTATDWMLLDFEFNVFMALDCLTAANVFFFSFCCVYRAFCTVYYTDQPRHNI